MPMDAATAVIAIVPVILIVAIVIYVVRGTMDNNSDKIKTILGATVGIVLVCCIAIPIISGLNETEPEPAPTPQSRIVTVNTSVELNAGESYTFTPTANVSGVSYTLTGSGVTINGLTITGEIPGTYSLNLKAVKVGYTESNTAISVSVVSVGKVFTIPASVTDGDYASGAFDGCPNITAIEVEAGNTELTSINGCLYNADGTLLFRVPEGYPDATFTVPAAATDDGYMPFAFYGCSNITSIEVENGSADYSSINGCLYSADGTSLLKVPEGYAGTTFTVPAAVTVPEGRYAFAFDGCSNITSIEVENGSTYLSSINGCLYSADGTTLYKVPDGYAGTTFTVPASVTENSYISTAFDGCSNITAIEVESENSDYSSINGCLYSADGTILYKVPAGY